MSFEGLSREDPKVLSFNISRATVCNFRDWSIQGFFSNSMSFEGLSRKDPKDLSFNISRATVCNFRDWSIQGFVVLSNVV